MIYRVVFFFIANFCWFSDAAESRFSISDEQIALLGIRFDQVQATQDNVGHHVSGVVVNSPYAASSITALFDGILTQWHALPGEHLRRGDVVATISSQSLLEWQNRFLTASAELDRAKYDLDKNEQLFSSGVIAETRLKQSQQQFQKAQSNLKVCRQRLSSAGFTSEQQNTLQNNDMSLGLYYLRTPVSSYLAQRHFRTGDFVKLNTSVATLQSDHTPWVKAKIPVALAQPLEIGQRLMLSSGEQLNLRQKNIAVDQKNQLLEIFAELKEPGNFYTGQLVTLVLPSSHAGVFISSASVTREKQNTRVYVKQGNEIEVRTLSLQAMGESYMATEGIQAGEVIAVEGAAALKGIEMGLGGIE